MVEQTWVDRLTDENNPWFNATKLEESGEFTEAFKIYLKDATDLLNTNHLCSAALSCACAANCVARIGDLRTAHQLYLKSGLIYEKNSDEMIGESVRETLWSLQEAYEYYLLAADESKAQRVFNKYVNLVRKINPISGEEEALEILKFRKKTVGDKKMSAHYKNLQVSAEISKKTDEFLQINQSDSLQIKVSSDKPEIEQPKPKLDNIKVDKHLKDEVQLLRGEVDSYQNKVKSLKTENEQYKTKLDTIQDNSHLKDEVQLLKEEMSNSSNLITSLKTENEQYKTKPDTSTNDSHLKDEVQLLREEITNYQNKVNSLKTENEQYVTKAGSIKDGSYLKDEVLLLKKEIDNYQNKVNSLKTENEQYKTKLDSITDDSHLKDEVQLLREEITNYQNKVNSLKTENEQYVTKAGSIKDGSYLKDEVLLLKKELAHSQDRVRSLKSNHNNFSARIVE